eukprot:7740297-Heterocapsa_arctica.AAC.1
MADDVNNRLYTIGTGTEQILHPQSMLSQFAAYPKYAPKCEECAMAGAIAGKHLMGYVRAAKANQGGAVPLMIMAVPDLYYFYEEELANDPFNMYPGIIMGHDNIQATKAQQIINSSSIGTQVCIIILDPSADTIQHWHFAMKLIGRQDGICLAI